MKVQIEKERINEIKEKIKALVLEDTSKAITKDEKLLIRSFISKFIICEKAYKRMVHEIDKKKNIKNICIKIDEVKKIINVLNYNINENLLIKLFGSNNKRGEKTAKKLRDALSHDTNDNDIKELKEREKELFNLMNKFIMAISK